VPRGPSTNVEVAVQQNFDLIFNYPGLSNPYTLQTMTTMRIQ